VPLKRLNGRTKQCAICFYYSTSSAYAACVSCMIGLRDVRIELMSATRKHMIDCHDAIDGSYCSNCRNPLFFYFSMQYVPICTQ